jgi:hypothetical protein
LGISSYLNADSYNGLVQQTDAGIIYNNSGLCICPQNSSTATDVGIRMDSSGKIGVNRATPTVELDVNGAILAQKYLRVNTTASLAAQSLSQGSYFTWNNSNGTGETCLINSRGTGTGGFAFVDITSDTLNSNTRLMTITGASDGGKVGIGTSTPSNTLDVIGSARIGLTNSNVIFTPKWNASGTGNGFWMDIPIQGPSGIGSGGAGQNPWVAYAWANTNWFSNSLVGDICYRNTGGRLLFGTNGNNSGMMLSNNCLIMPSATTSGTYRLDVTGDARVTGTLTTGTISTTSNFSAPNISTAGTLTLSNNTTTGTRFSIVNNNVSTFTVNGSGRTTIIDTEGGIATPTAGSLVIMPSNNTGVTSIVFTSKVDYSDDWAFIQYEQNYDANTVNGQKGKLTIGVENEASQDEVWITSCNGNGKIKLHGNVEITGTVTNNSIGIRAIRHFLSFLPRPPASGVGYYCLINHVEGNLKAKYLGTGKYQIEFLGGVPPNVHYSVSITGTWNGREDYNSALLFSVGKKTTSNFIMTMNRDLSEEDGDDNFPSIPCVEVTISY